IVGMPDEFVLLVVAHANHLPDRLHRDIHAQSLQPMGHREFRSAVASPSSPVCGSFHGALPGCTAGGWNSLVPEGSGVTTSSLSGQTRRPREAGKAGGEQYASRRHYLWRVLLRRLLHAALFGALSLLVTMVSVVELIPVESMSQPDSSLVLLT